MLRIFRKPLPEPALSGTGFFRHNRVQSFNHDGLELARIKRKRVRYLPVWHVIFFVYFVYLVRLVAMADMGVATYQSRIDQLAQGNVLERTAAVVMHMDPVSRSLAIDLRATLQAWTAYTTSSD